MTIAETRQPDLATDRDGPAVDYPAVDYQDIDYPDIDFADVPAAEPTAVVDPHWLELRGDALLPSLYMPPTMAGRHSSLMRMVASALIGVFMLATSLGICLTYGPPPY